MRKSVKRFILALVAAGLLMGAAGSALHPLYQMRKRWDLTSQPETGLSPELALATRSLGWARGILIDIIWIRLESLKQQGRFFELAQLADWACKLSPGLEEVWSFQSWNMAYNVSPQIDYLPDRWDWIWNGIQLLIQEGIPANPDSPQLYQTLAMTIWHKIGQDADYAHIFYKARFARIMHELLGGPGDEETLRAYADAPRSRRELRSDPQVDRLLQECQARDFDLIDEWRQWEYRTPSVPEELMRLLQSPQVQEPLRKVEVFLKARRLGREFGMDPELMLAQRERYADDEGSPAPFDWRSPYPHGVYWADRGLEAVERKESRLEATAERFGFEVPEARMPAVGGLEGTQPLYMHRRVELDRIRYGAMKTLVQQGRLLFGPNGELLYEVGADYRFADATLPLFERVIESATDRYRGSMRLAYLNFLSRGIVEFYVMGATEKARDYYDRLRKNFGDYMANAPGGFEEFVEASFESYTREMSFDQVRSLIRSYEMRALYSYASAAYEKAEALQSEAEAVADQWNENMYDTTMLRNIVRIDKIRQSVLVDFLSGRGGRLPEDLLENLKREIGREKVEKVLASLEAQRQAPRPGLEDLEEERRYNPGAAPPSEDSADQTQQEE